jgi:hypothetical protein
MNEQRNRICPNNDDFEDLHFTGLDIQIPRSWVKTLVDFLWKHDHANAIGLLTLTVAGVACWTVSHPVALVAVVSMLVAFATFVILIGRSHGNRRKTSSNAAELGSRPESEGEIGADE